ncbi:MAG: ATP-binding protein [Anaerovoracaceae bacterium]|nr:ATP-binding protein [Anaerovoracaceae bacterium]
MKTKFFASVFMLAFYNILIASLFIAFSEMRLGVYFIASILGSTIISFILYQWLIRPVMELQRQLEEAENIRKEFVANVTHEFKTPLTSISGFLETLQSGAQEDPEVRRKFLDILSIETSRLTRLIEDLLIISEIENKRSPQIDESFDVKETLTQIIRAMKPISENLKVKIQLQAEDGIYLRGSEDRFTQMLVNLIENALKYSEAGSEVLVHASKMEASVEVFVRDYGIGIANENIPRLFERFYRIDKSRSQKMGGTGLGLSIVKHAATLFNAKLRVESAIGQGSTFYIEFPV